MKTRVTPPVQPVQVIVTQPGLLANFDGITPRGSRMTGQRFSSSTFPVPAAGQILADGTGGWLTGSWTMDANAPGNPFRHKYHPDHDNLNASFSAYQQEAYPVTRHIQMTLGNQPPHYRR